MVVLLSGKVLTGKLIRRDEFGIALLVTANGVSTRHDITVAEIETDDNGELMATTTQTSAMPLGIDQLLNREELDDLLRSVVCRNQP